MEYIRITKENLESEHICCAIAGKKDPQYLAYKGFQIADTAKPYFTLMYLSFDGNAEIPQFKACAKEPNIEKDGFTLYYTNDCPYTAKYVPVVEQCAVSRGIPFTSVHIDSLKRRRMLLRHGQIMPCFIMVITSQMKFYQRKNSLPLVKSFWMWNQTDKAGRTKIIIVGC